MIKLMVDNGCPRLLSACLRYGRGVRNEQENRTSKLVHSGLGFFDDRSATVLCLPGLLTWQASIPVGSWGPTGTNDYYD
jgi:hypothetical protein